MMVKEWLLTDEAEQLALGAALWNAGLRQGAVYLRGDLGAGKTTLTRGLLRAAGHQGTVKSPTFTLVEPYQVHGLWLFHLDLYRLEEPEELELLGIRDLFDPSALLMVEWPERGYGILPSPRLDIRLSHRGRGRLNRLEALDAGSVALLEHCSGLLAAAGVSA